MTMFIVSDGLVSELLILLFQTFEDAQKGNPTRPQAKNNRRRTFWGTLRIVCRRERSWAPFSACCSHVAVFAEQLHPSPLILRPSRPLRHGRMAQFIDDIVHRLGGGLDGEGARRTTEASIPSALAPIQIEIDKWNIFEFDVLPDIDLGPVQQWVNTDMRALRKGGFKLVPQLRWLIAKIPIAMLVPRRKITLFGARAFFIRANAQDDARIAFLFD